MGLIYVIKKIFLSVKSMDNFCKTYKETIDYLVCLLYNHSRQGGKYMNILISTLSQTPIYEQIQNQIKEMVLSGKLKEQEQLPSIRLMAKDLKVGIITVKRAYKELENEGIIVNLQGRGCFVAKLDKDKIKNVHLEMLKERLIEIKEFTDKTGIEEKELLQVLKQIYGGNNHGE